MLSPIFESWTQDRSRAGNTDIAINLYPEHVDGPDGPAIGVLLGTPGYTPPLATVGTGPIRRTFTSSNGLLYVLSGNGFYSVDSEFIVTLLGTVGSATGPASIIESPTQILVVEGTGGWVWNFVNLTFTQVIPNGYSSIVNPTVAVYQDGFGLVNSQKSNIIYQTNYNDFSSFAVLNVVNNAFVQGNPQWIISMYDLKREVWIFKQKAIEIWINQGDPGFAFVPLQGVYPVVGCAAVRSVARLGDGLAWLGSSEQGTGVVYHALGYNAKPISTHAITAMIQSFPVISDATAYSYQMDQHYFYVLTFPSANITFVYDMATGKWHQRAAFSNGVFNREIANSFSFFNGQNVVGDSVNGNLYALSDSVFNENGAVRKWMRSWRALPPSAPAGIPMSFDQLQIFMETGVTVPSGLTPEIMLEWSDDGGYTFIGSVLVPAGQIGQTTWRVIQNRLGSTKIGTGLDRIFRISGVDPIRIAITGADVQGGPA